MILRLKPLLLTGLLLWTAPAGAQPSQDDLEAIERQLRTRAAEEQKLRKEAAAREKEIAALRRQLIETADAIQDAERSITGIEERIAGLEIERVAAQQDFEAAGKNLSELLAGLQSLERSRPPTIFVSPDDANKAARAAMLLSDAAPAAQLRAEALKASVEKLAEISRDLEQQRTAFAAVNNDLSARRDVLAGLMQRKEQERDVAIGLAAAAQKETAQLAARATSLRDVIRRLERLAHLVTPRLKPPAPRREATPPVAASLTPTLKPVAPEPFVATSRFADARGALRAPVAGRLVGAFGAARPEGGAFEGVRFAARDQAIVTAPFEGRVVFARDWQPVGNLVVLDVGQGYHILLIGVGEILAREGLKIAAGEPVARMAGAGATLDLEIRKNGEPVNPALWLSQRSLKDPAF